MDGHDGARQEVSDQLSPGVHRRSDGQDPFLEQYGLVYLWGGLTADIYKSDERFSE